MMLDELQRRNYADSTADSATNSHASLL